MEFGEIHGTHSVVLNAKLTFSLVLMESIYADVGLVSVRVRFYARLLRVTPPLGALSSVTLQTLRQLIIE